MSSHRLVQATCHGCGRSFPGRACDLARGNGRFCSRRCSGRHSRSKSINTPSSRPNASASRPSVVEDQWPE